MTPFEIMESNKSNEPKCLIIDFEPSGNSTTDVMKSKKNSKVEFIRYARDMNIVQEKLQDADIVFIAGGLDGQKEKNNARLIAKMAKNLGALSVGVIAISSEYDEANVQELTKGLESVIVIPKETSESLKPIDIIEGIIGVVLSNGDKDITLDWADLATVMSHKGVAEAGIGEYQGEKAAYHAMNKVIALACMNGKPIKNASGILVHFTMHPEFDFMQLSEAMDIIHNNVKESADVIFGTTTDETLPIDFIRATLIATGFEKRHLVPANNVF
ncbi:MAG: hypothetical protein AB7S65_08220 [Sulfuricurvum sp.]